MLPWPTKNIKHFKFLKSLLLYVGSPGVQLPLRQRRHYSLFFTYNSAQIGSPGVQLPLRQRRQEPPYSFQSLTVQLSSDWKPRGATTIEAEEARASLLLIFPVLHIQLSSDWKPRDATTIEAEEARASLLFPVPHGTTQLRLEAQGGNYH